MRAIRHNPRLIALVIYALLVNLAWFAAASAHHADAPGSWCSQTTVDVPAGGALGAQGDSHEGCHHFCGATVGAATSVAVASPIFAVASNIVARPQSSVRFAWTDMAWQARGPPAA